MRQLVIQSQDSSSDGSLASMGSREEITRKLADLNTAPESSESERLYGPGIILDFAGVDPVNQMMLTIIEEEIAWLVIMRIVRAMNWKLLDLESGRELNFT